MADKRRKTGSLNAWFQVQEADLTDSILDDIVNDGIVILNIIFTITFEIGPNNER